MTTALVIDGDSLVKRCIMASALDDLKSGKTFTGGVYGTLNILRSFLDMAEAFTVGPIVAFFDGGIPPERLQLLPDYKSERAERKKMMTEEDKEKAFEQMGLAEEMLNLLGVRVFRYADTEADDCVAAACRVFQKHDFKVIAMTGDKDLWQVVRFGAEVWDLNKKRFVEVGNFDEAAGVSVASYLVYRALIGDPSDSIKGCPGCGPGRAAAMIMEATEKFGDFETLTPYEQMARLRLMAVTRKPKPRKFEQALYANYDYLLRVLKVMDLKESFGRPLEDLWKWLSAVPTTVSKLAFLRFCKKLSFKSVLAYPDKFVRPFERCAARAKSCGMYGESS
jgi:DNA polymerase-1